MNLNEKNVKRSDYLSWDSYFMGVAKLIALRSKDPNTQVGCCIVSDKNIILSTGYNGMPYGCSDNEFPWARDAQDPLGNNYMYVVHSELNAILNCNTGTNLENATLYVTLFPCNECTKAIIQSGIKKIIYEEDKYAYTPSTIASKKMLDASGVKYCKYKNSNKKIELNL